jgi:hypothetical protein
MMIEASEDLDAYAMKLLENRIGKGHKRMLITKILNIVNITGPFIKNTSVNGDGFINVIALTEVEIFMKDKLLIGCQVIQIQGDSYYCNDGQYMIIIN